MSDISLVVPLYNKISCINVLAANICRFFQDFEEIIIVDDCSTDDSLEKLLELVSHISNVKHIKLNKNVGPFEARLTGIRFSKSPWVQLLDADDELIWVLSYSDIFALNSLRPVPVAVAYKSNLKNEIMVSQWSIFSHGWPDSSNIIVSRAACLSLIEVSRLSWGEDHVFFAKLFRNGRILYRPGVLAKYRLEYAERSRLNGSLKNRFYCSYGIFNALTDRSIMAAISVSIYFLLRSMAAYFWKKVSSKK